MRRIFALFFLWIMMASAVLVSPMASWATCTPQSFDVVMATPLSSRINWAGDAFEAILSEPVLSQPLQGPTSPVDTSFSAGTLLTGRVLKVDASRNGRVGRLQPRLKLVRGRASFYALVDTSDGWLHQTDMDTAVWRLARHRSTVLLSQKLQRRLSSDMTVWSQVLGINSNTIPDVFDEDFMKSYNRNDVLVGAGDKLRFRIVCP